jgi:hypothetical protein
VLGCAGGGAWPAAQESSHVLTRGTILCLARRCGRGPRAPMAALLSYREHSRPPWATGSCCRRWVPLLDCVVLGGGGSFPACWIAGMAGRLDIRINGCIVCLAACPFILARGSNNVHPTLWFKLVFGAAKQPSLRYAPACTRSPPLVPLGGSYLCPSSPIFALCSSIGPAHNCTICIIWLFEAPVLQTQELARRLLHELSAVPGPLQKALAGRAVPPPHRAPAYPTP